jgi:short-subunit dehydrogenase
VTGATAGIGAEFARQLAAEGYGLILVARDAERLARYAGELAARHGVDVRPLPADLSTESGCDAVAEVLRGSGARMLVNNAGLSLNTTFLRSSVEAEERLLAVNVRAVMRLTLAALPGMVASGGGDIVNVSSVAGFGAGLPGSTYPASKAWVTNFSESVGMSVRRRGVRVMAVCPGFTRTEFHQRAGIEVAASPGWLWLTPAEVVRDGLRDLRHGKAVSVPSWRYKILVFGMRHAPRTLFRRLAGRAGRRIGRDGRQT